MTIGRNEPCPCGSGKKFKACCLPLGRRLASAAHATVSPGLSERFREGLALALSAGVDAVTAEVRAAVALAGELCLEPAQAEAPELRPCILAFAAMAELLEENGGEEAELVSTFLPRLPFDVLLDAEGRTVGDLILGREGEALPPAAREALRALVEAEDALCRVERAGGKALIADLRSGAKLPAPDAFRPEGPGMICRLVRHRGTFVPLDAELVDDPEDPWYLEDFEAALDAGEALAGRLGLRLRSRGKAAAMGFELLDLPEGREEEEPAPVPDIRNAEGHDLVFTTLRWDVVWEAGVRASLAKVEGLELEETPEGLAGTFVKVQPPKARKMPGESLTVGTLKLGEGGLTVETNSSERADRLRKKLDKALGRTVTFRGVTREPLEEALKRPVDPAELELQDAEQRELMSHPEVREALAKMAREHSLAWCDMVIPALGNRRPRSLVKTEAGRGKVRALLADFERREAERSGNALPMDLDLIRRELGLDGNR